MKFKPKQVASHINSLRRASTCFDWLVTAALSCSTETSISSSMYTRQTTARFNTYILHIYFTYCRRFVNALSCIIGQASDKHKSRYHCCRLFIQLLYTVIENEIQNKAGEFLHKCPEITSLDSLTLTQIIKLGLG